MAKKVVKSISVDPQFYRGIEELAHDNRIPVSVIVEEALKEAIKGEKSIVIANILARGKKDGKKN